MQHNYCKTKTKAVYFATCTLFDVSYVIVRAHRDPGSSRVQASCTLHQIYMFQLDWKRKEIRC